MHYDSSKVIQATLWEGFLWLQTQTSKMNVPPLDCIPPTPSFLKPLHATDNQLHPHMYTSQTCDLQKGGYIKVWNVPHESYGTSKFQKNLWICVLQTQHVSGFTSHSDQDWENNVNNTIDATSITTPLTTSLSLNHPKLTIWKEAGMAC